MPIKERQDIQSVNIHAEQLNFLLQTIFEHHDDFDCHQLKALCGLAYDLAGNVYEWTEAEEKIVSKLQERERNG